MSMNKEQIQKSINKLLSIIKPPGVNKGVVYVDPIDNKGYEYYMHIYYIVPDDSGYLKVKNKNDTDFWRAEWNNEIRKNIKNYLDINVIINSSSIQSESYYERLKEYENG